jgi:hypothetical protein
MILPRSAWVDPAMPVVGPAAIPSSIVRVAIHYTAAPNLSDGDAGEKAGDVPAYLRAIHRDYTVNRGYSIGYSFAADAYGQAWQLRGLDIKCAANKGMNDTTYAILCLVDGDNPANDPMTAAIREIVATIYAHLGRQVPIVGHRDIGATACPGVGLYAQVKSGTFIPTVTLPPIPPTDEDDMALHVYYTGPATPDGAVRPELLAVQGKLVGFASPQDRDEALAATDADRWAISNPAQYDEVVRAFRA